MERLNVVVQSKCGLHARPASLLVGLASRFSSNITLRKKDRTANAKSIMGVLSIAASKGDEVEITVEGLDEAEAAKALAELFNDKLPNE